MTTISLPQFQHDTQKFLEAADGEHQPLFIQAGSKEYVLLNKDDYHSLLEMLNSAAAKLSPAQRRDIKEIYRQYCFKRMMESATRNWQTQEWTEERVFEMVEKHRQKRNAK